MGLGIIACGIANHRPILRNLRGRRLFRNGGFFSRISGRRLHGLFRNRLPGRGLIHIGSGFLLGRLVAVGNKALQLVCYLSKKAYSALFLIRRCLIVPSHNSKLPQKECIHLIIAQQNALWQAETGIIRRSSPRALEIHDKTGLFLTVKP